MEEDKQILWKEIWGLRRHLKETHGDTGRRHAETLKKMRHGETSKEYIWRQWKNKCRDVGRRHVETLEGDIGRKHVKKFEENTRRHWKDTRGDIRCRHGDTLEGDTRIHGSMEWRQIGGHMDWRSH